MIICDKCKKPCKELDKRTFNERTFELCPKCQDEIINFIECKKELNFYEWLK